MADRIAVMRAGRILQVGAPAELYFAPSSAFVAGFLGDVNAFPGTVSGDRVPTPLGSVPAGRHPDGAAVQVLIRPEAIRLLPIPDPTTPAHAVRVIAARLLGRTSLVHLCVGDETGAHLHLHARIPGRFLPAEDTILAAELDRSQAFVFPREG